MLGNDWLTWEGLFPGLGGALTADVITAVEVEHTATATKHAIETGSKISDHVMREPPRVRFEFAQSELPNISDDSLTGDTMWIQSPVTPQANRFKPTGLLLAQRALGMAASAIAGAVLPPVMVWNLTARLPGEDRVHKIHNTLIDVLEKAHLCAFHYRGLVLTDYVLTSVRYSRQAGEGGLARFTLSAEHIMTVKTAASSLAGVEVPSILAAVPLSQLGRKTVKQVEAEVKAHANLGLGLDADLAGL
ncbi:MAG: phage baseplate protein [bacterium]